MDPSIIQMCVFLTFTNDGESEPCESFLLTMNTSTSRVKTANDTPVTINDDDGKLCL